MTTATAPPRRRIESVGRAVLWAVVAGGLPVLRTWEFWFGSPRLPRTLAVVAAVAVAGAALACSRRWTVRHEVVVPIALVAGVGAAVGGGRVVGVWAVASVVAATWGGLRRPPLRAIPRPDGSAIAPQVLLVVIGGVSILLTTRDQLAIPSLGLLGALVLAAQASWPQSILGRGRRAVERASVAVGRGVATALVGLVGSIALLPGWGMARLAGWAPEDRWRSDAGGWVAPRQVPDPPERLWAPDPVRRRLRWRPLVLARAALVVAVVAAGISAVPGVVPDDADDGVALPSSPAVPTNERANPVQQAMYDQPWWNDFTNDTEAMYESSYVSQFVGLDLGDVSGRDLEVIDGRRRSWRPEGCGEPLEVWMFGGSTLFGVGQRDAHTVPSELARLAAEEGLALDVGNFGVPGDVAWQELRRLERELADTPEADRPDLVVFYDGANDLLTVQGMVHSPRELLGDFIGPLDRLQMAAVSQLVQGAGGEGTTYQVDLTQETGGDHDPDEVLEASVDQYVSADELAEIVLEGFGLAGTRVLQPMAATRRTEVAGGYERSDEDVAYASRFVDAVTGDLPDLIDLTTALDDHPEPAYNDSVHVDEAGNLPIAAALLASLRPRLETIADDEGRGRCS